MRKKSDRFSGATFFPHLGFAPNEEKSLKLVHFQRIFFIESITKQSIFKKKSRAARAFYFSNSVLSTVLLNQ